jgi:hypothetical protein
MRNEKMPMDDGGAVGTGSYGTFVVARRQPVLVCSDDDVWWCQFCGVRPVVKPTNPNHPSGNGLMLFGFGARFSASNKGGFYGCGWIA